MGTGPGDPELLTVKAARVISEADLIFAPNNKGKNMALDSTQPYIKGAKVVLLDFPMGRVTEEDYLENQKIIQRELKVGQTGVYLTIGDATIFSTIMNLIEIQPVDMEVEFVPGVPSFLSAANAGQMPLVFTKERFLLTEEVDREVLGYVDSLAVLKTFRDKRLLLDLLEEEGFDYVYYSNISGENQKILKNRKEIIEEENYLSLILGRRKHQR